MQKPFSGLIALALAASIFGCKKGPPNISDAIHLGVRAKIRTLDPVFATDTYTSHQVANVYEGLFQYHYLKRPFVLEPNLAASFPSVSKDGLTYVIKIRQGIVFQDDPCFKKTEGRGRELVAEDFVYSWKRLADPKNVGTEFWIFEGLIDGMNEWRAESKKKGSTDFSRPIRGLEAVDRYTLRVRLTRPSSQFLYKLAMPGSFVVAREAVEAYGGDFRVRPVGTGPFQFDRDRSSLDAKLIYYRNPSYWDARYPKESSPETKHLVEDAGKPLPLAAKLVVHVIPETQSRWLKLLSGEVDIEGIPKEYFTDALSGKGLKPKFREKGFRLTVVSQVDLIGFVMNTEFSALKNKKLRQAINLAFDGSRYIDVFFNGRVVPGQSAVPPGVLGYDPNLKNSYRHFNLAKAKALLAQAGHANGKGLPVLELSFSEGANQRQIAEFLQQNLKALNIRTRINQSPWNEFSQRIKTKRHHIFGYGWVADYPDAENLLQLFYSKNVSPGPNGSNYSNPRYDAIYEKATVLSDGPEKEKLYRAMAKILAEDVPWVFVGHRKIYRLSQPWIKNYTYHQFDKGHAKYLRIDMQEKRRRLSDR